MSRDNRTAARAGTVLGSPAGMEMRYLSADHKRRELTGWHDLRKRPVPEGEQGG